MNSQKRTKIFRKQYHPAFCCAAELDFSEDRENLMYREEFILNTAPNRIDLLVIKKESGVVLKNNIGAIFQKYNILEYKSPKDGRMLNAYYITNAYANLLIGYSLGPKSFDDVTVTFIRNSMPQKLMEFFRDNGYTICKYAAGIYHVTKASDFDRQIIVINELDKAHRWLKALSDELSVTEAQELVDEAGSMDENDFAKAVPVIDIINEILQNQGGLDMGKILEQYTMYMKKIREMDEELNKKKDELSKKNNELSKKNNELSKKNDELSKKDKQLSKKTQKLKEKEKQLKMNEKEISLLRKKLEEFQKLADKTAIL